MKNPRVEYESRETFLADKYPDYPHFGDMLHPMRENEAYKGMTHNFDDYLDYMHGQVKELCTGYGKIDIFWLDFSYGEMKSEKWSATELVRMVRKHQPEALINNRLEGTAEDLGSLISGQLYFRHHERV